MRLSFNDATASVWTPLLRLLLLLLLRLLLQLLLPADAVLGGEPNRSSLNSLFLTTQVTTTRSRRWVVYSLRLRLWMRSRQPFLTRRS